jgi:hypothetical protein
MASVPTTILTRCTPWRGNGWGAPSPYKTRLTSRPWVILPCPGHLGLTTRRQTRRSWSWASSPRAQSGATLAGGERVLVAARGSSRRGAVDARPSCRQGNCPFCCRTSPLLCASLLAR